MAPPADSGVHGPSGGPNVAATVVGSAAASQTALDGFFTPALLAALGARPDQSIDEVLWQLAAVPPPHADGYVSQHPSIVQYGQTPQGAPDAPSRKQAVLIGNQNYAAFTRLSTPIAEVNAMKTVLAARGYEARTQTDQTAAEMGSAWGAMVRTAKPGDELVAYFSGHGMPEGLAGVKHAPRDPSRPPDLFSNQQVSGVVSSATGRGAHIRFVMDSCHAGAAVQTVREERAERAATELASADPARAAALADLHQAKQRLLALRDQRATILGRVDQAAQQDQARGEPASRDVGHGPRMQILDAFERAMNQLWHDEIVPILDRVRIAIGFLREPPAIRDHVGLDEQLRYFHELQEAIVKPAPHAGDAAPLDAPGRG